MRKTVLYIAMSLDGFIADTDGGIGWLAGDSPDSNDTGSYPDFINTVDTVILGYKTYHQIITELSPINWAYPGKKTYVLTHRKIESTDEVEFVDKSVGELLRHIKRKDGKDIWICGGSNITNQFIERDMIDIYHITFIPILLGDGIRLFEKNSSLKKLKLISHESYNGMVDLVYMRS